MLRLLGLRRLVRSVALKDPVEKVVHDERSAGVFVLANVERSLPFWYRFVHHTRRLVPLALLLRIMRAVVRPSSRRLMPDEIGVAIHAVELKAGLKDCYPRAVVTAYLCLRQGYTCEVTVGVLAPTRLMHAWCSTAGLLLYEPTPEHYMYEPLVVLELTPLWTQNEHPRLE